MTDDQDAPDGLVTDELFAMHFENNRLQTFLKEHWPFFNEAGEQRCLCTPAKMAEAGFYYCPTQKEPDLVRCFVCLKELDGWEPEDDPWDEHKGHCPCCPFVLLGKPEAEITLEEFLNIERQRFVGLQERRGKRKIEHYKATVNEARCMLIDSLPKGVMGKKKKRRTATQK